MNEREIYDLWAPSDNPWSAWAKPVLFTQIGYAVTSIAMQIPNRISWPNAADLATQRLALILDIPGEMATNLGVQLVECGYCPVPLFNTSYGMNAVVPVQNIITALGRGISVLKDSPIRPDAPPVFLLDSNRMREQGSVLPGKYDNRWLVFPQDFPSGKFLHLHGIAGVILVQERSLQPQEDLSHVLLRWQEEGVPLLSTRLDQLLAPEALRVTKPTRYRSLWYHFLAILGLRRNSAGGFGAVVPEPSQGGGGFG